jgi:hypothetical protein
MRCTCDQIHELDPLHPETEYCPIHDVDFATDDDVEDEWGGYYEQLSIIDESDLDDFDS